MSQATLFATWWWLLGQFPDWLFSPHLSFPRYQRAGEHRLYSYAFDAHDDAFTPHALQGAKVS
ncbi:uncharacterized protein MEPE_02706 [Melanopsichium pennsylvanicum]|uniref:Uncharacterized protein n=1 Tax=Melanopsichium pennsylvanicum TaxID=63383 RepID=A0AAJ5C4Y4_9BASI|nr:uncharacterized protein MEPE_02706 [Melanopsichium pennsylvanicum]